MLKNKNYSTIIYPKNVIPNEEFKAARKECIFDVDDVFMSRRNILTQICAYARFLYHNANKEQLYKGSLGLCKHLLTRPFETIRSIRCFEEVDDNNIAQHGECFTQTDDKKTSFWADFKQVHADNVRWLRPMVNIIKDIHHGGYSFNIATNQSQAMVNMWLSSPNNPLKNAGIHPTIVFSKNTVKTDNGSIVKKPNPLYFEALMKACKEQYPQVTSFVFIDDKRKNVLAAVEQGFIGVVAKNAQTVRTSLEEIGVFRTQLEKSIVV